MARGHHAAAASARVSDLRSLAVPAEDRFIWLLEADGNEVEFEARDAAYYASEARTGVRTDPRQWIVAHSSVFLQPVPLGDLEAAADEGSVASD